MGVFYSQEGRSKNDSRGCFAGKARRDTRSVATGISHVPVPRDTMTKMEPQLSKSASALKNGGVERMLAPGGLKTTSSLEARSILKAAERIAKSFPGVGVRCLVLSDNMSAVLAYGRCRARDSRFLQVRRLASPAHCRGIEFVVRWIPSEFNVAGGGTRDATSTVFQSVTTLLG